MEESTKFMLKHSGERFRNAHHLWEKELEKLGAINLYSSEPVIPAIFEGDKIIYEGGSATCVVVVLYDPDNHRGTMLHIPVTTIDQLLDSSIRATKEFLPELISQMRAAGSKRVLALLAGGVRRLSPNSKGDKKKSNSAIIWKLVLEILKENSDIVQRVKAKDLKDVYVVFIVLYLKTGLVKYLASGSGEKALFNDELVLE